MRGSYKVEVVAYILENDVTIYKLVEKHYFLGIRMYKEEHSGIIRDLEQAKLEAKRLNDRLFKSYSRDVISKRTVYTIKG